MTDKSRQMTEEEAAQFVEQVFNVARQGDAQMLDKLAASGLPVNLRNHKGDTLLMLAAYHGHVDAVQVLLKHQADPEIRNDNGQSPIAGAAFKGDLAVVKALSHQLMVVKHGQVVEQGDAQSIFAAPQHPYTQQLLEAAFLAPATAQ